jgi:TonB family protein
MYLLRRLLFLIASLMLGNSVHSARGQARGEEALKGFYVVTHVVSDASPFRYEYILDVQPQAKDVLVRDIRIGPTKFGCPKGVTVKAAEHLIKSATAESVARIGLCSLEPSRVDSAIAKAEWHGVAVSIDDTASYSIVAKCGKTERVFEIPYPEQVELGKLKKSDPEVASLWDLNFDVLRRAFGKHLSFYNVSQSEDDALQALGAGLAPSIKSGRYQRGLQNGSHLEALLNDYAGPVTEVDPWNVEFLGSKPANLLAYRLPIYPPLARQTRIEGEVRLLVTVDPNTGLPEEVNVVSGHPLFRDAVISAVRSWHFHSGIEQKEPLEIGLRFVLRCPSD